MKSLRALGLAAGLFTILSPGLAKASYPAGVWVKAQSVEYEPSAAAPTRIRITGAAMLYDGNDGGTPYYGYTEPARGVLYYECPAAQLATCVSEWNDIVANVAAPPQVCVGLGDQSQPTGRLRPLGEAPASADVYPIHMGILPGYSPCDVLRQFLSGAIDAGAGSGGTGGAGGSAGAANGGTGATGGAAGEGSGGTPGTGASSGAGRGGSGHAGVGGSGAAVADASAPTASAPSSDESSSACSVTAARSPNALSGISMALLGLVALRRRRSPRWQ